MSLECTLHAGRTNFDFVCVFVIFFVFYFFSILSFCQKIVATESLASTMIFLRNLLANYVLKMACLYNIAI